MGVGLLPDKDHLRWTERSYLAWELAGRTQEVGQQQLASSWCAVQVLWYRCRLWPRVRACWPEGLMEEQV